MPGRSWRISQAPRLRRLPLWAATSPARGCCNGRGTWACPASSSALQNRDGTLQHELASAGINLLLLAGFMRLLPPELVRAWPGRILNIHPSLLPKYGGKGMYGHRVHQAVLAAGEKESGITIHLVNERYDEGKVLFQAKCPVLPGDDAEALAARIHGLEHAHYPVVVENYLKELRSAPPLPHV